ncbi:hypothetical protein [Chroococcidiopsis sp. CCMEE 29]|uniref:hypothetical protein n=1 Tax=Chroococcidiopsis sp. CCMEE 29 TaxID=155894 RepID=UPI0020219308|nr:hypothetical protein [Chroococcidiopsis sp. CCMEE 29]
MDIENIFSGESHIVSPPKPRYGVNKIEPKHILTVVSDEDFCLFQGQPKGSVFGQPFDMTITRRTHELSVMWMFTGTYMKFPPVTPPA